MNVKELAALMHTLPIEKPKALRARGWTAKVRRLRPSRSVLRPAD
jgi:hypothetical protein